MKRYLSVFEMITRSSIYKVLLVIAALVVADAVFLYLACMSPDFVSVEEYVVENCYSVAFKIAYVLVTIAIVLPGMNIGSTQSYTLQRLCIKERWIFWLQAIYNFCSYVILWGAQLMMLLLNVVVFQKNLPEGAILSNQTMFLAFYRNDFMHTILPLEDGPGWWMLALWAVTTAFAAASFTRLQRKGKFGFELILMVIAALIYFPRALGYDIVFMVLAYAGTFMVMGLRVTIERLGGD